MPNRTPIVVFASDFHDPSKEILITNVGTYFIVKISFFISNAAHNGISMGSFSSAEIVPSTVIPPVKLISTYHGPKNSK